MLHGQHRVMEIENAKMLMMKKDVQLHHGFCQLSYLVQDLF